MKHEMFAIFDSKAHAYLPPFIMHQKEMAIRVFADCINDLGHQFGKNPGDYTLFHIGEFDDNKGTVKTQLNISLANGVELINPNGNESQQHHLFHDSSDITEVQ